MTTTAPTSSPRHHLARPPYVDPNTNIIYDTDRPEYEGWLTKQSMWLKVRREGNKGKQKRLLNRLWMIGWWWWCR